MLHIYREWEDISPVRLPRNRNWNGPRNCPHPAHRFAASKRPTLRSFFCLGLCSWTTLPCPALSCSAWLMVMIDEFHGLDATAASGIVRTTPSLRISLRFLVLLIYFQQQQQQPQPQPQQLSLLLPNLIQLNFVIYFIRLLLDPSPSALSLSLPLSLSAHLSLCSSIHWISVARRATRNTFLTFRTFPTHLHNTAPQSTVHSPKKNWFYTCPKHKK